MGASNVEFHLKPSLALVAKQRVTISACEVGPSTSMFVFHLLTNENYDFLVILMSCDFLMTRLIFKSTLSSKSHDGLTNPFKQADLLGSNLPPMTTLSCMEVRWHCLALSDALSL